MALFARSRPPLWPVGSGRPSGRIKRAVAAVQKEWDARASKTVRFSLASSRALPYGGIDCWQKRRWTFRNVISRYVRCHLQHDSNFWDIKSWRCDVCVCALVDVPDAGKRLRIARQLDPSRLFFGGSQHVLPLAGARERLSGIHIRWSRRADRGLPWQPRYPNKYTRTKFMHICRYPQSLSHTCREATLLCDQRGSVGVYTYGSAGHKVALVFSASKLRAHACEGVCVHACGHITFSYVGLQCVAVCCIVLQCLLTLLQICWEFWPMTLILKFSMISSPVALETKLKFSVSARDSIEMFNSELLTITTHQYSSSCSDLHTAFALWWAATTSAGTKFSQNMLLLNLYNKITVRADFEELSPSQYIYIYLYIYIYMYMYIYIYI